MGLIDVNDFVRETECLFEEEQYSVRDNGAVFRHARLGKRVRPNDNYWTFGKRNSSNPYLHLSDARIHRIVATAFHGEPPNPQYVVDHIDTNCRNNRPENLRWVTRLENALMNPVTRKKIEFSCGSIEAFLANPSMLNKYDVERNFEWMRTVTLEEAQNCKERMSIWAESNKNPRGGVWTEQVYTPIKKREAVHPESKFEPILEQPQHSATFTIKPSLEEWVRTETYSSESELILGLTKTCAQYKWRVPSYFPCCPEQIGANPLEKYFQNLKVGAVFSYNDSYPASTIIEFIKTNDNSSILVMCEREGIKPYSIAKITFENELFIHSNLGSFFDIDGAKKTFCLEQGLEWTGGETFDDYC
ncbi:HNH endonuclease signature motif containing protein [Legionella pneumophila serogroup 10]